MTFAETSSAPSFSGDYRKTHERMHEGVADPLPEDLDAELVVDDAVSLAHAADSSEM